MEVRKTYNNTKMFSFIFYHLFLVLVFSVRVNAFLKVNIPSVIIKSLPSLNNQKYQKRSYECSLCIRSEQLSSSHVYDGNKDIWKSILSPLSSLPPLSSYSDRNLNTIQLITLLRVGVPSIIVGVTGFFAFPFLALSLASMMNDAGVFSVLSKDSSQFVQNFLTVSGLLFSMLVGQTYAFLYTQQESVFYALFNEVTEAKSLLEQVALVCQGRPMYYKVLESISKYVRNDLKQLKADPAVLISSRPDNDPLESIMYITSVGVPSSVYDTVKSLRQVRATRLGALQRKLPRIHMVLLWILAAIELVSFPLLGAGTQTIGGYNILTIEGFLFGIMTFGIVMTMRVIGELYRPGGGAYNVDGVLSIMVKGLEEELKGRLIGRKCNVANLSPSSQFELVENSLEGINELKKPSDKSMSNQLLNQGSLSYHTRLVTS